MNEEEVTHYLIDKETGEVIDELKTGDRLKKVTKKQIEYLNDNVIINENKNWNKAINSSFTLLATEHLTSTECATLFILMAHIGWNKYSCYAIKLKNRSFFRYLNSNDINVVDFILETKLVNSKSEIRRLIEQGGISINQDKVADTNLIISNDFIKDNFIVIQKGKKQFLKVIFK